MIDRDRNELPRTIPVIDVLGGVAVHAKRGRRDEYRPIESVLVAGSDPVELARALVEVWGFDEIYIADLDALQRRGAQVDLIKRLADSPARILFDLGVASPEEIEAARATCGRPGVAFVLASEALADVAMLRECLKAADDPASVALGLDWRNGRFRTARGLDADGPSAWIDAALDHAVETLVALDVDRVGSAVGFAWPGRIDAAPRFADFRRRVSGGGVRSLDDLRAARRAGCDAVLVGSALHDRRIAPRDVVDAEPER